MDRNLQSPNRDTLPGGTSATCYTIFMPLNYNNGRRIQHGKVNWALNELARYAGGLSKFAPGIGLWISPNAVVYRDRVLPVQIVTIPDESTELWFTQFAAQLAVVLQQECIFLAAQPLWLMDKPEFELVVDS